MYRPSNAVLTSNASTKAVTPGAPVLSMLPLDTDRECARNLPMEDWKNLAQQIKVSIVDLSDLLDGRQFCLACTAASGNNIPLLVRRVMHQEKDDAVEEERL